MESDACSLHQVPTVSRESDSMESYSSTRPNTGTATGAGADAGGSPQDCGSSPSFRVEDFLQLSSPQVEQDAELRSTKSVEQDAIEDVVGRTPMTQIASDLDPIDRDSSSNSSRSSNSSISEVFNLSPSTLNSKDEHHTPASSVIDAGASDTTSTITENLEPTSPNARAEPIAVVGLALRFPQDADTTESFWRLLMEGRSARSEAPLSRINAEAFQNNRHAGAGSKAGMVG
jgi:hypothetical protein